MKFKLSTFLNFRFLEISITRMRYVEFIDSLSIPKGGIDIN